MRRSPAGGGAQVRAECAHADAADRPDELAPDSPGERGRPAEPPSAPAKPFDLANAYSIDGWFGDSYADLIPDRLETSIVIGGGRESLAAAHIAARLGLESTGVTIPIAKADGKAREPNREPSPILVGANNELVRQLVKIGKTRLDNLGPGDGLIHLVPRAFGNATATVVAGADTAEPTRRPHLPGAFPTCGCFAPTPQRPEDPGCPFLPGAQQQARPAGTDGVGCPKRGNPGQGNRIGGFQALPREDGSCARPLSEAWPKETFKGAPVQVLSQGITEPVAVRDKPTPWEVDDF
jgi:hypothetical protein